MRMSVKGRGKRLYLEATEASSLRTNDRDRVYTKYWAQASSIDSCDNTRGELR